jgi:L-fuconolactonase
MIDAHQHFWTLDRDDYAWLTPDDAVLYRDYLPADLAPLLSEAGIERSILVQAAPTVAETRYLLEIARTTDFVAGVVGWVPLETEGVAATLDALSKEGPLLGVRPMIQDLPDDDWMLSDAVARGLRVLADRDLRFDALVLPRHLSRLRSLLQRHPELRVVIDHGAKPAIAAGQFDPWAEDIARIAADTTAACKLSGLLTEAGERSGIAELQPYVDHLVACFGCDRLMWGSDWPVVELAGGFASWRRTSLALLEGLTGSERSAMLGGTATRFYGI